MEYRVEFDYEAEQSDELNLKKGDIIKNVVTKWEGWWEGTLSSTGQRGLFPDNFVKVVSEPEPDLEDNNGQRNSFLDEIHRILIPENSNAVEDPSQSQSQFQSQLEPSQKSHSITDSDELFLNLRRITNLSENETRYRFRDISPNYDDDYYFSESCSTAKEISQILKWQNSLTPKSYLKKVKTLPGCNKIGTPESESDKEEMANGKNPIEENGQPKPKQGLVKIKAQQRSFREAPPISTNTPRAKRQIAVVTPSRRTTPEPDFPEISPEKFSEKCVKPKSASVRQILISPKSTASPERKKIGSYRGIRFSRTGCSKTGISKFSPRKYELGNTSTVPKKKYDTLITDYFKIKKKWKNEKQQNKALNGKLAFQNFEERKRIRGGPLTKDKQLENLSTIVATLLKKNPMYSVLPKPVVLENAKPMNDVEREEIRNQERTRKSDCDCLCFCEVPKGIDRPTKYPPRPLPIEVQFRKMMKEQKLQQKLQMIQQRKLQFRKERLNNTY